MPDHNPREERIAKEKGPNVSILEKKGIKSELLARAECGPEQEKAEHGSER